MKVKMLSMAAAAALLAFGATAQAATLSAQFFQQDQTVSNGDFGPCCSSPPATLEVITPGSGLTGGMPTLAAGSTVVDQAGGALLWWTPGQGGITSTGSGTFTLGQTNNMFPPNSTGSNNSSFFETAILSGTLTGFGKDAKITIAADDDALVYLNGAFVGGLPGVHATETTTLDLGVLNGTNTLQIFYADRAQVGANLFVSVAGAGVPEPATWAMLILGVAMVGFFARRRAAGVAAAA